MPARIGRRGWWRQRRGFHEIQFFEYNKSAATEAEALIEVEINFRQWDAGPTTDEATHEARMMVKLMDVDNPEAFGRKLKYALIDGLYYEIQGVAKPVGSGTKRDWVIDLAANANEKVR